MEATMKYLKWALIIGVFTVPFIPFIISSTMFFPFITGKNFIFRIVIDLLAAMLIIVALRDPSYRPRFSWLGLGVLALLASAGFGVLFGVDSLKSFWGNFERMEGWIGLLHMTLWFFITSIVLSTEKLWNRFMQVSIAASVIMGIYVLFQVSGALVINQGGLRTDGTFGNAIYLAVYMLFHVFFTLLQMVRHTGPKWVHALYVIALILQGIGIYFAATRSVTLGLLGGLLVAGIGITLFYKDNKIVRRTAIGVLVAVVIIVVGFFALRNAPAIKTNPILGRFASISTSETTVKSRFMIWNMALQGLAEKPVFGWGQENFNFVFNKYYNPKMYGQEQWFDRAHNAYLDWAIAGGILALLAFLSLFGFAAWAFLRGGNLTVPERSVLLGLLAAYAFHSFFVFDNLMSSVYFFFLLAYAHSLIKKPLPSAMLLTKPVQGGAFSTAAIAVVVVMGVGTYFINMPAIHAARNLINALTPTKAGVDVSGRPAALQKDPNENYDSFVAATTNSPLGRQEAVEQLLQTASNAINTQGIDAAVKTKFADLAIEKGAKLLESRPNDARLELFYGSFLSQLGKADEGRQHLLKARDLSPNKQTVLFELGVNSYLRSGDTANAIAILKKAYELAPEYAEAALYYAMGLIYAGDTAAADALLTKQYGTTVVDDNRLISAYIDSKQFTKAIAILKVRVEKNPSDPQSRVTLASAYKSAGDNANAAQTLRDAIRDFPQYASDLQGVASQLGITL